MIKIILQKIKKLDTDRKINLSKATFLIGIIFLFLKLPELSFFIFLFAIYVSFQVYGKYGMFVSIFFTSLLFSINSYFLKYDASKFILVITLASYLFVFISFIYIKFSGKNNSIFNEEPIFSLDDISSFPQENKQHRGYKFSTIKELKRFNTGIRIDNFNYYPIIEEHVINKKHLQEAKDISIKIDNLNFTKTFLILGAMGSGKTEFFHSIINQDAFKRKVIHDVKGDFVEKWYDDKKDFIFNPYDKRGVNWDLWEELKQSPGLVENFVDNLMKEQTDEKDFFTASAKKVIIDFFMEINYQNINKTSQEKWELFNKKIETYKIDSESNKTKGSIYQTMDLVTDIFSYLEWHTRQNKKNFTINDFLQSDGTLFLLNTASVSNKLTPLFTGFISLFTDILLSKPDTKENLTLILIDEYLSMTFEKQTRLKLLTQVRSKGGCLMLGMQYLPKSDIEHQQILDSSCYGKLIFQINDNETINHIIDSISDITYASVSGGTNTNKGSIGAGLLPETSTGRNNTESENTKKLLTSEHLKSMPQYSHISIFSSEKLLYLGYTPLVENLILKNLNFDAINQNEYYASKYITDCENNHIVQNTQKELEEVEAEIKQLENELKIVT